VAMGSYPFARDARTYGTQLVLRSADPERLAAATEGLEHKLKARGLL
jgi:hypothetical protein